MRYVRVALLVLVAAGATAEPLQFSVPSPLTNTRYGPISGTRPVLTTNGTDFFLLFMTGDTVRITRVGDGEPRTSIPILRGVTSAPSVVWTGTSFLVAAQSGTAISGIVLDHDGLPLGQSFKLVDQASTPLLATNGRNVMLLYSVWPGVARMMLTPNGKPIGVGAVVPAVPYSYAYAIASNGDGYLVVTTRYSDIRTVRFDEEGDFLSTRIETGMSAESVAIASDGRDYLVVARAVYSSPHGGRLLGLGVHADGTSTAPVVITTTSSAYNPSIVWTDRYVVAYGSGEVVSLLEIGRDAEWFGKPVSRAGTPTPTLAAAGGRLLSAWPGTDARVLVRDETTGVDAATVASYGALDQVLDAVASSAAGTLFVWREGTTLHAGVRSPRGDWWESAIGPNLTLGAAAGSGEDFLVVARSQSAWLAIRLGPTARRLGAAVELPSNEGKVFTAAVWNGRRYVIAGLDGYNRKVIAIGFDRANGTLTGPVVIRSTTMATVGNASIATDGTNALVAWEEFTNTDPLYVARVGPNLEILDGGARHISADQIAGSRVVWTGSEYVVVWIGWTEGVRAQRVAADGRRTGATVELAPASPSNGMARQFAATTVGASVALVWREADGTRPLLIVRDGQVAARQPIQGIPFDSRAHLFESSGRVGVASVQSQPEAPHHGGARLMFVLAGDAAFPARPTAPTLQASLTGGVAALRWSAPSGEVHGYRVEYRIGEGAWNELEDWLGPAERATSIRLPDPSSRAAFRVRAFNEGGPGEYSAEAHLQSSRRRAVR